MILETSRTTLHRWTRDDVPLLHPILSDPETMRFWPHPFTLEDTRGWIERNVARYSTDGFGRMRLVLKETGETVGDCGLGVAQINGRRENDLGYILHHPWWGRGLAIEAARACVEYGFATLDLTRLVANMAEDHLRSAHVAEQLGMRLERRFLNARNRNLPTRLYALEKN